MWERLQVKVQEHVHCRLTEEGDSPGCFGPLGMYWPSGSADTAFFLAESMDISFHSDVRAKNELIGEDLTEKDDDKLLARMRLQQMSLLSGGSRRRCNSFLRSLSSIRELG